MNNDNKKNKNNKFTSTDNPKLGGRPNKDFSFLMESRYVKKWVDNYKSDTNARLSVLSLFIDFTNKTPEELILEHNADLKVDDPIDKTDITKQRIKDFYEYLLNQNISSNSARQYAFSKVASFYKRNNVPVVFQKGEVPKERSGVNDKVWRNGSDGKRLKSEKDILISIRDALSNVRDKAILLCKMGSGLDDVDLFNLKVKDFQQGYYEDLNVCYIHGYRQKNDIQFQTFFSSEACDIITIYFKERNQKGDKITPDKWLFTSEKANDKGKYTKIKPYNFSENLKDTTRVLGIRNITPKSIRRWFNTVLKREIDFEIVERLMGHVFNVSLSYQKIFEDPDQFAEFYSTKIDPIVSLQNGNKKYRLLDESLKGLKADNSDLRKEVDDLKLQLKEWTLLKEQIKDVTDWFQNKRNKSPISKEEVDFLDSDYFEEK